MTWCLGVAACIFLAWLVLRVDDYPIEVLPSGLGLIVSIGLLYVIRSHASQRAYPPVAVSGVIGR